MDSDDWEDLGDNALWFSGPGWIGLAIGLVFALILYWIASSARSDEDSACKEACSPGDIPVVVKSNHRDMLCQCQRPDDTIYVPREP